VNHLIFSGAGVYEPLVCPKAILWTRWPDENSDPNFGVFVPSPANARKFAQVIVLDDDGNVVKIVEQEER